MSVVPPGSIACIANALFNLRSSTDYNADHGVKNSILNHQNSKTSTTDGSESWSSSILDKNQYIVAGSDNTKQIVAISTQGRGDSDQWVTSYRIRYTLDNVNWIEYKNGEIINANTDRNSVVTVGFNPPIRCRSIAIHPQSYNNHISLRWEIYAQPRPDFTDYHSFVQVGSISIGCNELTDPKGSRQCVRKVVFPKSFNKPPMVQVGCRKVDARTDPSDSQMRWEIIYENVTNTGFDVKFITWNGNQVYDLIADYVAVEHAGN